METLEDIKEILFNQQKESTAKIYFSTIKQLFNHFNFNYVKKFLYHENLIIEYLEENYKNYSTLKGKLSSVLMVFKIVNEDSPTIKKKIKDLLILNEIETNSNIEKNKKTQEEGNEIITYFKNEYNKLKEVIKINDYNQDFKFFILLRIYLFYGIIRPDEMINIKILNYDGKDNENYINVKNKMLIINNHKNETNAGTKKILLDKETIDYLKNGLDQYLISSKQGKPYLTSSSFSKAFKKRFNDYNVYDLRKATTSGILRRKKPEEIKKLQYIQGHDLQTQLTNYNIYTNNI